MAISATDPKPARLESQGRSQQRDYGIGEAMEAYTRACRAHGWQIPRGFNEFAELEAGGAAQTKK
jgi:ubiquitin-conjugating enzyme E2 Q